MGIEVCPSCNRECDNLVVHHWYELPDMELHTQRICDSCVGISSEDFDKLYTYLTEAKAYWEAHQ